MIFCIFLPALSSHLRQRNRWDVEVPCVATLIWNLRVRLFFAAEKHLAKTHGKTPCGS